MHGGFDFQRENDRHGFSILKFVISSGVKVSPIDSYVIVHTKDKDRFPTIYLPIYDIIMPKNARSSSDVPKGKRNRWCLWQG